MALFTSMCGHMFAVWSTQPDPVRAASSSKVDQQPEVPVVVQEPANAHTHKPFCRVARTPNQNTSLGVLPELGVQDMLLWNYRNAYSAIEFEQTYLKGSWF